MTNEKSNAGQALGIAGFVLGLLALIISFIPCLGTYALFPGIIAVIFSAIALSQASKANASKGLIIAALVISLLGSIIASYQYYALKQVANNLENVSKQLQEASEDLEEFNDEFDDAVNDASGDLDSEDVSDEVENDNSALDEAVNNKDYDKALDIYEKYLDKYVAELQKYDSDGDGEIDNPVDAIGVVGVAAKLSVITVKIATVLPQMSDEQRQRFDDLDNKYKKLDKKSDEQE